MALLLLTHVSMELMTLAGMSVVGVAVGIVSSRLILWAALCCIARPSSEMQTP
jgi:ABC-type cobalamin transport system permease subunit